MVAAWEETEDPMGLVAASLGDALGVERALIRAVAVSDGLRAAFVLGLQRVLPGATFSLASAVLAGLRMRKDADEIEVLFTLMAERYERRSMLITSNLVFSQWDRIFKNPMTTAAAIDRLVHHSVILEFDVDSYRTKKAKK